MEKANLHGGLAWRYYDFHFRNLKITDLNLNWDNIHQEIWSKALFEQIILHSKNVHHCPINRVFLFKLTTQESVAFWTVPSSTDAKIVKGTTCDWIVLNLRINFFRSHPINPFQLNFVVDPSKTLKVLAGDRVTNGLIPETKCRTDNSTQSPI